MIKDKIKPKGINEHPSYKESPYTIELRSKEFAPKADDEYLFTTTEGDMYAGYKIPKNKVIVTDPKQYTKLFRGNSKILASLNEASTKMFYFICDRVTAGSNTVCIMKDEFLAHYNYKLENKPIYYKALIGLLHADIIARQVGYGSCFYINPDVIFNGDRTKLKNVNVKPPDKPFSFNKNKENDL